MPFSYRDSVERLAANSEPVPGPIPDSPCWIWHGGLNSVGRPLICVRILGEPRNMLVTTFILTRVFKLSANRNTGKNRRVGAHDCDNKLCVNPDHIKRKTQSRNMRDCIERGRHVSQKGAQHGIE